VSRLIKSSRVRDQEITREVWSYSTVRLLNLLPDHHHTVSSVDHNDTLLSRRTLCRLSNSGIEPTPETLMAAGRGISCRDERTALNRTNAVSVVICPAGKFDTATNERLSRLPRNHFGAAKAPIRSANQSIEPESSISQNSRHLDCQIIRKNVGAAARPSQLDVHRGMAETRGAQAKRATEIPRQEQNHEGTAGGRADWRSIF